MTISIQFQITFFTQLGLLTVTLTWVDRLQQLQQQDLKMARKLNKNIFTIFWYLLIDSNDLINGFYICLSKFINTLKNKCLQETKTVK